MSNKNTLSLAKNTPTPDPAVDDQAAADQAAAQGSPAPKMATVVAVNGDMLNLLTNVWITKEPKEMEIDAYVECQQAAGKVEYVTT